MAGELVWVKGLKGPTPEKRPAGPLVGGDGATVLARHALSDTLWPLPLKDLEALFPAPAMPKDEG